MNPDPTFDLGPQFLAEERDRLARMAKLAHDAGIEDRRVELAEAQGELVATVILAALADPEWSLPPAAQEAGRVVLGRHLRKLGAGAVVAEG